MSKFSRKVKRDMFNKEYKTLENISKEMKNYKGSGIIVGGYYYQDKSEYWKKRKED